MKLPGTNKNLRLYGLTGCIGSGKTTAAKAFARLGAHVISADVLAREVVKQGSPALKCIQEHFGDAALADNGELNRQALGKLIFENAEQRKRLEEIVHPRVRELYLDTLKSLAESDSPPKLVIYDVPLLYESKYDYKELDGVIVVYAPEALSIQRIVARDECSHEQAKQKYDSQISIDKKKERADFVLDNSGTKLWLEQQVATLYQTLVAMEPVHDDN